MRVQKIVDELGGEKIDIIQYSDNIVEYVSAALPLQGYRATQTKKKKFAQFCGRTPTFTGNRQEGKTQGLCKVDRLKIDIIKTKVIAGSHEHRIYDSREKLCQNVCFLWAVLKKDLVRIVKLVDGSR